MFKYSIVLMLLLVCFQSSAQVVFQFIPEISGRSVDGIFNCRINNLYTVQNASLNIVITERAAGTVCIIKTPAFQILPGNNPLPSSAVNAAAVQFTGNRIGQLTASSRLFPEGDYEYCFSLNFINSDNPPLEQCFSYTLAPFADLHLIEPYNQDQICEKRPLFSWQPLIPGVAGAYYQLVLTEIKQGQNATEALNYNLPIINQRNIPSPILPYPSIVPQLEKDKQYAWQVTAYKDQTILNRSEVWSFTLKCTEQAKAQPLSDDGYREIDDLIKGNYYIAYGFIKFMIVNPYENQALKYNIQPLSGEKTIQKLPKIKLRAGDNKVFIDLADQKGLHSGKYYLMNIWLPDGSKKVLRFLYENI
ncbi:hypothetical protein GCM10027037_26860 [Mucilaginibacter koreensis]